MRLKPIVGLIALGVVAYVLVSCYTSGKATIGGCNNFCLSVYGGIGLGSK